LKKNKSLMVQYFFAVSLLSIALMVEGETEPQNNQQKGRAIFEEIDRRDLGFKDFSSQQEMVLRNKSGQESRRLIENTVLEGDADSKTDGDKTLIVFREPKRIRGTALITHAHSQRDDDQWLYLPALGRVKRISGASKAGSFVGSEFSYEDLAPQEVDDYSYEYIGDEYYSEQDCFKVIRVPKDEDSGYTRQIVWIDKAEYRIQQIEFYDRKHTFIKKLTVSGYQLYLDQYWRPGQLSMVNQQDGKSTDMIATNYVFRQGLTDADFSENSLRRVR
jgi:outer membrane lipoprotein-sorting protein